MDRVADGSNVSEQHRVQKQLVIRSGAGLLITSSCEVYSAALGQNFLLRNVVVSHGQNSSRV